MSWNAVVCWEVTTNFLDTVKGQPVTGPVTAVPNKLPLSHSSLKLTELDGAGISDC